MRFTIPLVLCCALTFTSTAKEKVRIYTSPSWLYKTSPDLHKTPNSRDISNGYYFNLMDEQTNVPAQTEYTHYIKQIVNESGVQNASEVSVTFSPGYQELVIHQIVIHRDNEVINQLLPGRIKVVQEETDAAEFEYHGLKRAFVTLKDVRKGDQIEVAFSLIGFNPVFAGKFSDKFHFSQVTAICNYYKTIVTAADRPLIIRPANNAPNPAEQRTGNTLIYHWSNPPLKTWESQSHVPSWYDNHPVVSVSEYPDWQGVVNWGTGLLNHYHYPLPAGLQKKITQWKKEAGDDKDAFANLVARFVQDEVRYLGLEIGPGTHQPRPPAAVFTHRFGDCKDKSLLLAAILKEDSINAYVALTSTTHRSKLAEAMPSTDEFNHAIVAIERSRDQFIFIDPTIPAQRGSLLNRFIPDYGYALVLRQGERQLRPVEPGFLNSYTIIESLLVHYDDSSRFNVTSTYAGGAADDFRHSFSENSIKELEDDYRKYYAAQFDGIRLAGPLRTEDDTAKDEFTVNESYAIPQIWNTNEKGKKSFDFTASILAEHLPSPASLPADAPMALRYPVSINYTLKIRMPENWRFQDGPLHIKNDSYQFDFIPEVTGDLITLQYYFKTFKDHIPAAGIAQYKADYKNISGRIGFQLYKNTITDESPADSPAPDGKAAPGPGKGASWPAIWLTFFFGLMFTILFRYLNARRETVLYSPGTGYPLGGWTVVLGITMGVGFLAMAYRLFTNNYFNHQTWSTLGDAGGAGLQFLLLFELLASLTYLACTGALLYWYLGRRDIFPRMFVWYAGILLSVQLGLIIAYSAVRIPADFGDLRTGTTTQFFRALIYSAIWVSYILRSERVKATFLEPYRGARSDS